MNHTTDARDQNGRRCACECACCTASPERPAQIGPIVCLEPGIRLPPTGFIDRPIDFDGFLRTSRSALTSSRLAPEGGVVLSPPIMFDIDPSEGYVDTWEENALIAYTRDLQRRLTDSMQAELKAYRDFNMQPTQENKTRHEMSVTTTDWLKERLDYAKQVITLRGLPYDIQTLQHTIATTLTGLPQSRYRRVEKESVPVISKPIIELRVSPAGGLDPQEQFPESAGMRAAFGKLAAAVPTRFGLVGPVHAWLNCRNVCGRYFYIEGGDMGTLGASVKPIRYYDMWNEGGTIVSMDLGDRDLVREVALLESSEQVLANDAVVRPGSILPNLWSYNIPRPWRGPNSNTYLAEALKRAGLPVQAPIAAYGWITFSPWLFNPQNLQTWAGKDEFNTAWENTDGEYGMPIPR